MVVVVEVGYSVGGRQIWPGSTKQHMSYGMVSLLEQGNSGHRVYSTCVARVDLVMTCDRIYSFFLTA
jgi:hypothetical protein